MAEPVVFISSEFDGNLFWSFENEVDGLLLLLGLDEVLGHERLSNGSTLFFLKIDFKLVFLGGDWLFVAMFGSCVVDFSCLSGEDG